MPLFTLTEVAVDINQKEQAGRQKDFFDFVNKKKFWK